MKKVGEAILTLIISASVIGLILGFPTKWLWNYLMPDLFGLEEIHIWQAFAMNILASLLFKANVTTKS